MQSPPRRRLHRRRHLKFPGKTRISTRRLTGGPADVYIPPADDEKEEIIADSVSWVKKMIAKFNETMFEEAE
jgi:hypothetical protein